MRPSLYGRPDTLAKPTAAGIEESGTGMTTSASAGCSSASSSPSRWRTAWTPWPSHVESGREKYTNSNAHRACLGAGCMA
ncbi:unannotated protein [freshwater metagenome]|uniref:Unannotated protein n=1 Tax=freshwater metagenome TaxID=449393 RepID=A0A6J6QXG2_9ZZZZ